MIMNERITENIVRNLLRESNYYSDKVVVEEQISQYSNIADCFKNASKSEKSGNGFPEFIIHSSDYPDHLILIECKPNFKNHGDVKQFGKFEDLFDLKNIKHNAIEGILHYAKFAKEKFNVIAIAVSGNSFDSIKVSCYFASKKSSYFRLLKNSSNFPIESIIPFDDFVHHCNFDSEYRKEQEADLIKDAKDIHQYLYENAKITENEKPLLIAGTFLALSDNQFVKEYDSMPAKNILSSWYEAICRTLEETEIPKSKKTSMQQGFITLKNHPILSEKSKSDSKSIMHGIVDKVHKNVMPHNTVYQDRDVMGLFYGEFLKYSAGDGKSLGIVLTPKHITELCCDIANLTKDSKVLDPCAGTGGFLISAMHKMIKFAQTSDEIKNIKENNLFGVEQMPVMFTIACTNMILRGDGKSNLYQGSCFDTRTVNEIKSKQANIGLINPPYAQGDGKEELVFVDHMMNMLVKGSIGIAVIPSSCGNTSSKNLELKKKILSKHSLLGVMTLPPDLFSPTTVNTCIMVFESGTPHKQKNVKTWFANFQNDGFTKSKDKGRSDSDNKWQLISEVWVEAWKNRENIDRFSTSVYVDEEKDWNAGAYLTTNYSKLNTSMFEDVCKLFKLYRMNTTYQYSYDKLDCSNWKVFSFTDLFDLKRGTLGEKESSKKDGNTPLVTASATNNGIKRFTDDKPKFTNIPCITVANNGSVGETFIQDKPFNCSSDVTVLEPKFDFDLKTLLFISTLIKMEKENFNYGFKWNLDRMKKSTIKLPHVNGEVDLNFIKEFMEDKI